MANRVHSVGHFRWASSLQISSLQINMQGMQQIHSVFVYGTLKRGQIREAMWPLPPLRVVAATIRANLHDLGPYPAITDGDGTVGGEVWVFREVDMHETLRALDEIEWYQQDENDLYIRRVVNCRTQSDAAPMQAYTYFYANTAELTWNNQIVSDVSVWPTIR